MLKRLLSFLMLFVVLCTTVSANYVGGSGNSNTYVPGDSGNSNTYVPGASDVSVSGSTGESVAELNQEASTFSVTVPSSLPVYMDEMGNVTVATNARIVNNGVGPVVVSSYMITPNDPWDIVWTEDPYDMRVGSKKFSMALNGESVHLLGERSGSGKVFTAYTVNYSAVSANGGILPIEYSLSIAPQAQAVFSELCKVVVRVMWDYGYAACLVWPVQYENPFIQSVALSEPWHMGENTFVVTTGSDDLGVRVFVVSADESDGVCVLGERVSVGSYRFTVNLSEGYGVILKLPGDLVRTSYANVPVVNERDLSYLESRLEDYFSGDELSPGKLRLYDFNLDGVFDELDIEYVQNIIDTGIYPW